MSYADTLSQAQTINFNQPQSDGEFHVPALRREESAATGHAPRPAFEADEQVLLQQNDLSRPMMDRDFEVTAMLTEEQRARLEAEEAGRINLGEEKYDPEYFNEINEAAKAEELAGEAHSYYAQERQKVAAPEAHEKDVVTYEKAEQWALHPEMNLPHLSHIGQIVKSSRDDFILAS